MSIFRTFEAEIARAVASLAAEGALPAGLETKNIVVEPPRDASHGDLATNAAMVLAKPAGKKPRDIAEQLVARLRADSRVTGAEIAGPGFINLRLDPAVWQAELRTAIEQHVRYGDSAVGGGLPVNVEYVSANPTGPMHVGHCRGAVLGDAMANMLAKVGFKVAREYYINDAGGQIEVLARSTYLRYREALGETITIPDGLYPGDYLKPVGEALAKKDGTAWRDVPESEWLPAMKVAAVDAMMALIRDDLAALGIAHDVFFSERTLHESGAIPAAIADLEAKGLIYVGTLEPPKGQKPDDWEERPQTLFRATQFGDDVDRPLKKSDGSFTYFAADIAYHREKYRRGFNRMIDVLGVDHAGYIKRVKAAVAALTDRQGELDVKTCNLVKLLRAGEPVKMSKRSGDFVTLRDVVDEVGKDVVRFMMLTQKPETALDFDFAKVMEQSKDNPVFYVQYAHARIRSVMRRAAAEAPGVKTDAASLARADLALLAHAAQASLMKLVAQWPRVAEGAALAHEPHRIAYFLYDVASAFHALWNQGTEAPELRFLSGGTPEITTARLALIQGVAAVLASGLAVLGVEPVEEMRG